MKAIERRGCGERSPYVNLLSQFKRTYVLIKNYDHNTGTGTILYPCTRNARADFSSRAARSGTGPGPSPRDRDGLARIDCG